MDKVPLLKMEGIAELRGGPWEVQALLDCDQPSADAVPGAFTFLGIRNEEAGSVHGLHTARFQMDEAQMSLGAALHATVALDALHAAVAAVKADRQEL